MKNLNVTINQTTFLTLQKSFALLMGILCFILGGHNTLRGQSPEEQVEIQELLVEINKLRAEGCNCTLNGVTNYYSPAPALTTNEYLRRAAQAHSEDNALHDGLGHTGSDGSRYPERLARTGLTQDCIGPGFVGELVTSWPTPELALKSLKDSKEGHCNALMRQNSRHIGIGLAYNHSLGMPSPRWTITLANIKEECLDSSSPTNAPANDLCSNAEVISCGQTITGSSAGATAAGANNSCFDGQAGVWYRMTGNGKKIKVSTNQAGTSFDTRLSVYTGNCGQLTCKDSNDDVNPSNTKSEVEFESQTGQTYYIYIDGYNGEKGHYSLKVSCEEGSTIPVGPGVHANDFCSGAITVNCGSTVTDFTLNASLDANRGYGVWYKIIGTGRKIEVAMDPSGTNFNTRLTLYNGPCEQQWEMSFANMGTSSKINFQTEVGGIYYILVDGRNNTKGNFRFNVSCEEEESTTFNGTGLTGHYFDNADFTNHKISRTDAKIDFDWGQSAPHSSMGVDHFSVWWTGYIEVPESDVYTFYTRTDDGVYLEINNEWMINQWNQGLRTYEGSIFLEKGTRIPVHMQYFEAAGRAVAQLSWSSGRIAKQIIPTQYLYPSENGGSKIASRPTTLLAQATTLTVATNDKNTATAINENTIVKTKQATVIKSTPELTLFPNPARYDINVQFQSAINAPTQIRIFDVQGKQVATFEKEAMEGNNQFKLDISQLQNGHYILSASNKEFNQTERFMIVK